MSYQLGTTIGLLGGGQLGRMLLESSNNLGMKVIIVDPLGDESPAGLINRENMRGDFNDEKNVIELSKRCEIVTCEIEHISTNGMKLVELENKCKVLPTSKCISLIQDKLAQKIHLDKHNIPVADYLDTSNKELLLKAAEKFGYPFMLKSRFSAYDGRGNAKVSSAEDLDIAWNKLGGKNLYAERWEHFDMELAVMVVHSTNGETVTYPVVHTVQKDNICHMVTVPLPLPNEETVSNAARDLASKAVSSLESAGIFGVEMFLVKNGSNWKVVLNEIAPRPHNSGHYTIEACNTSQFENHLRAIVGLPLGSTALSVGAACMLNVLGADTMEETMKIINQAMFVPGATVHWYGKAENKKGRKMAHITVVADNLMELAKRMNSLTPLPQEYTSNIINPVDVGIIMGSDSDLPIMKDAAAILKQFGVNYEIAIVSAHRTPDRMNEYAHTAAKRGLKVIIAGAGGAAHLPGMVAAMTPLPVIGVPVKTTALSGQDSLLSIVQMPKGVPVATVAIDNSTNAALLAIRMLGSFRPELLQKMLDYQESMRLEVENKTNHLKNVGYEQYLIEKNNKH